MDANGARVKRSAAAQALRLRIIGGKVMIEGSELRVRVGRVVRTNSTATSGRVASSSMPSSSTA